MKDALSIHRLLLEHQTTHEIVRLPHPITSADELPEVLGLPAVRCLCTRLYASQGVPRVHRTAESCRLAAVIVTAGTWPSTGAVAGALDVGEVSPAPPDLVNEATDYPARLIAPLMLSDRISVLIDERATRLTDVVYTATGECSTALGIRTLDLFALCAAVPVPAPPGAAGDRPEQ